MLVAMADESGANPNAKYFSMVAYVAQHEHWREFNAEWRGALVKHGISHFHMWEFAGRRNTFKGWAEERRRALMNDLLLAIMSRPMYAVGAAMRLGDFYRLPKETQEQFIGPYMMCFYELTYGIGLNGEYAFPGEPVDFVYSRQDDFKRMMRKWWVRAKEERDYGQRLGLLEFQDMRTVPGLQAADLLAWEFQHFYHLRDTRPDLPMRYPYRFLVEHQEWGHSHTMKFLPGWYIEFQVKGAHNAAMNVIMSDPDEWRTLHDDLNAPGMNVLESTRMFRILERYVKHEGERPTHLEKLMNPEPTLPGGLRLKV
jgi:hypothetical protein